MIRSLRSEFVRARRSWPILALAVVLAAISTVVTFAGTAVGPRGGGSDPSATATSALDDADGIVAGLLTAAPLLGLLGLVLWGSSVARDLQTGTIRVLLVTQSRRGVFFAGKLAALFAITALMSIAASIVAVATAFIFAPSQDVATTNWTANAVISASFNTFLGILAWGAIGTVLAVVSRSIAIAIGGGIGYLLLGEKLVGMAWSTADEWLPGGVITNVFNGGGTTAYTQSLLMVLAFISIGWCASFVVITRRDITD